MAKMKVEMLRQKLLLKKKDEKSMEKSMGQVRSDFLMVLDIFWQGANQHFFWMYEIVMYAAANHVVLEGDVQPRLVVYLVGTLQTKMAV